MTEDAEETAWQLHAIRRRCPADLLNSPEARLLALADPEAFVRQVGRAQEDLARALLHGALSSVPDYERQAFVAGLCKDPNWAKTAARVAVWSPYSMGEILISDAGGEETDLSYLASVVRAAVRVLAAQGIHVSWEGGSGR